MKLATMVREGGTRACVVDAETLRVLEAYRDVAEVLAAGDAGRAAAASPDGPTVPLAEATLCRPVLEPGAIICVGLNFASHITEMGRQLPTDPTLFSKLPRALTDPGASIPMPSVSKALDYEGELCVVIGRRGRDISAADAWDHVGGLTIINDVTVRDYQWRTPQWFAGKTWERSTPVGPVVVTPDELGDVGRLELVVRVDGEERQRATLDDLVFDVPRLIEDVSRIFTLVPGDLIATGTPGGVGAAMDPKGFLSPGSAVEVAIDGIGVLRNSVGV